MGRLVPLEQLKGRSAHLRLIGQPNPPRPRFPTATKAQRVLLEPFFEWLGERRGSPETRPLSMSTRLGYARVVLHAMRGAKSTAPSALAAWFSSEIDERTPKGTASHSVAALRHYGSWYRETQAETVKANPAVVLSASSLPYTGRLREGVRDALLPEELEEYAKVVEEEGLPDEVEAVLLLLPLTAFRIEEIVGLRCADVRMRTVRKRGKDGKPARGATSALGLEVLGKGSKIRWVPLSEEAQRILERYVRGDRADRAGTTKEVAKEILAGHSKLESPLFLSSRRVDKAVTAATVERRLRELRLKHWAGKGNLAHVVPHVLRHCWATEMAAKGVPLPVLQRWLGHASIQTTQRYISVREGDLLSAFDY